MRPVVLSPRRRMRTSPSTVRTTVAGSSTRYRAVTRSLRPSPPGENTRGSTDRSITRGGVTSTRIGLGSTIVRPASLRRTFGRYSPSGTIPPSSLRPSQKKWCAPRLNRRSLTRVRTRWPAESTIVRAIESILRSRKATRARRCGHPHTGENVLSTCVPVIGERSSLRLSVTAKATAEPASSATTRANMARRRKGADSSNDRADDTVVSVPCLVGTVIVPPRCGPLP